MPRRELSGGLGGLVTGRLSDGFAEFGGRAWLNTAHQGALPLAAAEAARETIAWKLSPSELTIERFREVPESLRRALGRLLGVVAEDVILANSASYGLHTIANAYPWREGDEVLVMEGDFPSDILPWLTLEARFGVRVRRIHPAGRVVSPEELNRASSPRTRVFCTTWVHSFSGYAVDVYALGTVCRERGIHFVVNASQALGARPVELVRAPIDALVSAGFKWLCGPYGTGLCWIRPELRERLVPTKAYWLAMQSQEDLGKEVSPVALRDDLGARGLEIFGTANFFNFKPWTVAVEHLLELGAERIAAHDQMLVSRFIDGLDPDHFDLLSPREGDARSTLVFFSHRDRTKNPGLHRALERAGVDVALRNGALRVAPHVYCSTDDVDRALSVLNEPV